MNWYYYKSMKRYILLLSLIGIVNLSAEAAAPRTVPMPTSELNAISGHYSTTYGYAYVQPNRHEVFTRFNGKHITGVKKTDGYYYSSFKLAGFIPISVRLSLDKVNGFHRVTLERRQGVKKIVAQQFTPTPITQTWMKRLGEYRTKVINGKSKITKVRLETQNGIVQIRLNNDKHTYPMLMRKRNRLVRPTIGRPRQRHMEVWPKGNTLIAIIGNARLKLEKH